MTQVEKLVSDYEHANDTVYNLRLFITALRERYVEPDKWAAFEKEYSGLPGFVEANDVQI